MSGRMALHLPLIILLMIPGVYSADWGVSYSSSYICAIKGSSVIMPCTYTYPSGYQIMEAFWTDNTGSDPPNLFNNPEYSQRIHYLGDKQQNCTLRLNDVTQKDKRMYYFRFITDRSEGRWTGKSGVTLDVTDLRVESPESVTEGDTVSLTCKSTCNLNNRFIWRKNTQLLTEMKNKLLLQSVRREDAGRYSCAVHGYNHTSPPVDLNVMYSPRDVSVSIKGSGEILEGDSVTLTCSCDSNPPVVNYTWFKENENSSVGSGQSYSTLQRGYFYCVAQNQHGSQRSAAVSVTNTVHHSSGWLVVLGITVGCGVFIIIIIIIIKTRKRIGAKPKDLTVKQDDLYSNITGRVPNSDVHVSKSTDCDDAQYASVSHKRSNQTESRDVEEVQYATVQHHKHKEMKRPEENENQYDNIRIHHSDAATRRSNLQTMEDLSVIYSSVKNPV